MEMLRFRKVPTSDLIGKGRNQLTMDRVELSRIACYAAEDADIAWRLAWRDLRRGGRGLVLLAFCLFLGSAGLAGIGSLSASMLAALDAQGRTMLGGDLEMRVSQRRATVEEAAAFAATSAAARTTPSIWALVRSGRRFSEKKSASRM